MNYAFIDSQNLNLGVRSQGWRLDFVRFRKYLRDKYHVEKALLFLGYLESNQKLYFYLKKAGFILVFKYVIETKRGIKGNVDSELIVKTMEYCYEGVCDKAIVVSGDGDFAALADFLISKRKLLKFIIPNSNKMSVLLKRVFRKHKKLYLLDYLNTKKEKLAQK